ncbi:MAG: glycosyltransferase family 2 protein [Acidobacteria bacterium]|nr:glycosyltransferase family 2 protein [Acidobacteriota bacterium]
MSDLTIAICARNAALTVARAIASCLPEPGCRLLLVDDQSADATIERARAVAGSRLDVVRTAAPGGIGAARRLGLDAIRTPCAAWLDADDAWVPGRGARILQALEAGADIVADPIDLFDGPTGAHLRRLPIPAFLAARGGALRLFERNFLPGDTQVGFRTAMFRAVGGYDASLVGPESYDILLRAIAAGARLGLGAKAGYRMYAYPESVSRDLDRQRAALAKVAAKHPYAHVRRAYLASDYTARVAGWALVALALYRGDPLSALAFVDDASPPGGDPREVLEPEGPWPMCEGWRRTFARGAALLMIGEADAARLECEQAEALGTTAEAANNLGVALARVGDRAAADRWFARAAARFPGYRDARLNAAAAMPSHITTHPLRRLAARAEYAA